MYKNKEIIATKNNFLKIKIILNLKFNLKQINPKQILNFFYAKTMFI